jgi:hypothetical protein
MYVNDAIAMHLKPEITLRYSSNCFGTTDAINFENMFLRISDYKSGETPASMHQLEVYESLFCLEYDYSPFDIGSELRIYQNNEKIRYTPAPERIQGIMDNIIIFDREIERIMSEE